LIYFNWLCRFFRFNYNLFFFNFLWLFNNLFIGRNNPDSILIKFICISSKGFFLFFFFSFLLCINSFLWFFFFRLNFCFFIKRSFLLNFYFFFFLFNYIVGLYIFFFSLCFVIKFRVWFRSCFRSSFFIFLLKFLLFVRFILVGSWLELLLLLLRMLVIWLLRIIHLV